MIAFAVHDQSTKVAHLDSHERPARRRFIEWFMCLLADEAPQQCPSWMGRNAAGNKKPAGSVLQQHGFT
jgi:hypothetical protein